MRIGNGGGMGIGSIKKTSYISASLCLGLAMVLCFPKDSMAGARSTPVNLAEEPIQPVVPPAGLDKRKVKLGETLFNDVRLSANDTLACASCHIVNEGGALHTPFALAGVSGKAVPINVPSVLGSSHNLAQFWDGRAESLESQIDGPALNPDEMGGSSWQQIAGKLAGLPEYSKAFMSVYNAPPTEKTIKDALSTFERSLVPVNSPFDRYLLGDSSAISDDAKEGYALFKQLGCVSCHQGANIGGNMFQKFGVMGDYFKDRGGINEKDYGRFAVTHDEDDRYVFKVPSLRNVALTAPYFHDGSAATLEQAVETMSHYQLGRKLSTDERDKLVAYLKTLTGTLPPPDALEPEKPHERRP